MSEPSPIVVMTCFARSGGTLLNQCLSALPDTMMFSEVSPLRPGGGVPHLHHQASEWYGITLKETSFTDCLRELHAIATGRQQHLIIRDWPLRCFEGTSPGKSETPGKLVLPDFMPSGIPLRPFAFVRDAFDVFLSRAWGRGFPRRYRRYVSALLDAAMPRFTFEAFCQDPQTVMRGICEVTGLPFDPSFEEEFRRETRVTGDISLGSRSRGQRAKGIIELPRRLPSRRRLGELLFSRELREANRMLGYSPSYFSRPLMLPGRRYSSTSG
jgi:hypothetical protein